LWRVFDFELCADYYGSTIFSVVFIVVECCPFLPDHRTRSAILPVVFIAVERCSVFSDHRARSSLYDNIHDDANNRFVDSSFRGPPKLNATINC
jgi:hypothetical protein